MNDKIRLTIWNEFRSERSEAETAAVYPSGIHHALADYFNTQPDIEVRTATLDEPEHGLTDEIIESTDVLLWWAHIAHDEVSDEIVDKLYKRVLGGMGFIPLQSSHWCKLFKKLMGTSCVLKWREADEQQRLWVIDPSHPIADGIGEFIDIPRDETFGERFDIPQPDATIFVTWSEGGNVFRSGCCFHRNKGKVFYLGVGHRIYPIYYHPDILKILNNAVHWARPHEELACYTSDLARQA